MSNEKVKPEVKMLKAGCCSYSFRFIASVFFVFSLPSIAKLVTGGLQGNKLSLFVLLVNKFLNLFFPLFSLSR